MSVPRKPKKVKLFFAVLVAADSSVDDFERRIGLEFGEIESRLAPFSAMTDYYADEVGENPRKYFFAMRDLIDPDELVSIKLYTNQLEIHYAGADGARKLNIDPGFLNQSRVVLATGKDFAHRIYVGRGIYEEVTLLYRRLPPGFEPLPWTYRDYKSEPVLKFLNSARERCKSQLKQLNKAIAKDGLEK